MASTKKSFLKPSDLTYELLSEKHDLTDFDCEDVDYNDFIKNHALNHQRLKLGTTYLFFYQGKLVGYVTIAMGDLKKEKASDELKNARPLRNIPCLFLAQMARDKSVKRLGVGDILIEWVIGKAMRASSEIACRFVLLECEDHNINVYERNGFSLIPKGKKDKRNYMFYDLLI